MARAIQSKRRVYSPKKLLKDIGYIAKNMKLIVKAVTSSQVSPALREKIMLAVTTVNQCRYCSYVHTKTALISGVTEDQIISLKESKLGCFEEKERIALLFAQHFADSEGNPDALALQRLQDYYGPSASKEILMIIRMIMMGNLITNTVDAFLTRLKGSPA